MTLTTITERVKKMAGALLRPAPEVHWMALMTIAVVAFFGTLVWNIWAFQTVVHGDSIPAEPVATTSPASTDSASVSATRTLIMMRAQEEAKYADGTYTYADPSQ